MTPPDTLRALLAQPGLITMPCCFDPLSAKLIEQAGFPLTFMSGFAASAARLGLPDTGLMSYAEVVDQGRNICNAVSIPVIGDGDTGYGNAINVKRTVQGFARAGFAAVMIEDQVSPKRCGHVAGKAVVDREEAYARIRAAADARAEGADILILARTDARHEHGLDEAIARAARFAELGADILFVEAPRDAAEMARVPAELGKPCMANIVEGGLTPALPPAELEAMGYRIAAYPLTLLAAAMKAMVDTLAAFRTDTPDEDRLMGFAELKRRIGFDAYFDEEARYAGKG
ncbi:isocitrate lyase/PEP mutase family protein [Rhodovulum euryhalinum]|uniref:2-methylisocitrate lyase-like PEP mutase family enzyme n=1 Tax=Rhodovulum euryhalinum TaxID=35805 RepID=A0A4R2KIA0_9RHOB|nr:isocitrate lyase/PEP mutase family protein [Rhodovulum euryhalinum]TCO70269.1 2-methylisocitrate lyase-like PEP mutase family enzyme [Rhodovulum euryhalinum]